MRLTFTYFAIPLFLFSIRPQAVLASPPPATAPSLGITTFNNAFTGPSNLLGSVPSPGTITNAGNTGEAAGILATGWDFTVTAPAGNVSIAATAAGANPTGGSDYCLRGNSLSAGVSVQTISVRSDDASAFSLQSVYLKVNITAGAPADMTITGYRGGVAVPGATATVTGIATATWALFNLTAVTAFQNVTEFRFTQAVSTSATFSFVAVDQITIAAPVVLPLTLVTFIGQQDGNSTQLDWTTASEQNTRSFEVQRAADGAAYAPVARLPAAGNSVLPLHYHYTDPLPDVTAPDYLYRLKMEDLDGAFTYSPILRIGHSPAELSFSVYPNPFRQQISLLMEAPTADKALITITDVGGKILLKEEYPILKGSTVISLPSLSRLGKGVYLLTVSTGARKQTVGIAKIE